MRPWENCQPWREYYAGPLLYKSKYVENTHVFQSVLLARTYLDSDVFIAQLKQFAASALIGKAPHDDIRRLFRELGYALTKRSTERIAEAATSDIVKPSGWLNVMIDELWENELDEAVPFAGAEAAFQEIAACVRKMVKDHREECPVAFDREFAWDSGDPHKQETIVTAIVFDAIWAILDDAGTYFQALFAAEKNEEAKPHGETPASTHRGQHKQRSRHAPSIPRETVDLTGSDYEAAPTADGSPLKRKKPTPGAETATSSPSKRSRAAADPPASTDTIPTRQSQCSLNLLNYLTYTSNSCLLPYKNAHERSRPRSPEEINQSSAIE